MMQTRLICGFKQSGAEMFMHFNTRPNDGIRNFTMHKFCNTQFQFSVLLRVLRGELFFFNTP